MSTATTRRISYGSACRPAVRQAGEGAAAGAAASAPAKPVKCKDAKGKFAKGGTPRAKPV